jgi:hypothetical protein
MISYISQYTDFSARPKLVKRFTTDGGGYFDTTIVFENAEERSTVSVEEIYEYLGCLMLYIKDCVAESSPLALDEDIPSDGWPIKGPWGEVEWAKMELFHWWEDAYYRNEEDQEEVSGGTS